ncbi:adenylylsulfate kinase [Saccharomonospora amisosensis]|uniref:Adenylyl-sulfate kinase n=2 Tax=Saccharomonospora amisosensis TaxID=1128677 RepID=A0A7X5ZR82_9PSEU|nr:adenylylsulfate kinase [Saccharomonospora amisosensis]
MPPPTSPRLSRGVTVWLTGLPGAGKSTVARAVASLAGENVEVEVLDGDELRRTISSDLGFSRHDRDQQGRRVGYIAELLSRHRVLTLVPVIAPYAETRTAVRTHHEQRDTSFLEIHVSTPVEECARRDPKGLYARAAAGEIKGMTGVDDVYEQPLDPDLRIDTSDLTIEEAATAVLDLLRTRDLLTVASAEETGVVERTALSG